MSEPVYLAWTPPEPGESHFVDYIAGRDIEELIDAGHLTPIDRPEGTIDVTPVQPRDAVVVRVGDRLYDRRYGWGIVVATVERDAAHTTINGTITIPNSTTVWIRR